MQVLPPGASQADVYESAVSGIVDDVLGGFNGTIMAYGQVGLRCWVKCSRPSPRLSSWGSMHSCAGSA